MKRKAEKKVQQIFHAQLIEGALSGKVYFNMDDGKGNYFKVYPTFHAPEGDSVRVTIELLSKRAAGRGE